MLAAFAAAILTRHYDRLAIRHVAVTLPADGREHAVLRIQRRFSLSLPGARLQVYGPGVRTVQANEDAAEVLMRTSVNPGEAKVQVSWRNQNAIVPVTLVLDETDSFGDGTPDFLRLHSPQDRQAFRTWFTALADWQAGLPPEKLSPEIDDCAALLRFSYREALRRHDDRWLSAHFPGEMPSIVQYQYPQTPLGSGLFRVAAGSFRAEDLRDGAFAQFADARTLMLRNAYPVGRDIRAAQRGDLIFYRQLEQNSPYHSMILTGRDADWVVYHTGPIGRARGEMRRTSVTELLKHPDPRWRPEAANSNFLGVYRWNILRDAN